ncbi:MAG: PorT family protein [Muribaculaceae bacterium]|nr:PorT family protein [Muribaculaceae bacterium]
MKRLISRSAMAIVIAVAGCCGVTAQTHYKPHISVGVKGGMTLSEMAFSPSVKQKWNNGTTGAVTFRYTEEKLFGLIAELGWTQRGWAENFEESPCSYSRSLTYIKLPMMTHIYFGSRRFKCFINLGPEFSYLISEKISANFDYHDPLHAEGFPTKARMTEQLVMPVKNKFDYGIVGGAGIEFYISPRNSLTLEGRYYFGLGNIFPAAKADTFSASRNTSIEISLGYNFRLK